MMSLAQKPTLWAFVRLRKRSDDMLALAKVSSCTAPAITAEQTEDIIKLLDRIDFLLTRINVSSDLILGMVYAGVILWSMWRILNWFIL